MRRFFAVHLRSRSRAKTGGPDERSLIIKVLSRYRFLAHLHGHGSDQPALYATDLIAACEERPQGWKVVAGEDIDVLLSLNQSLCYEIYELGIVNLTCGQEVLRCRYLYYSDSFHACRNQLYFRYGLMEV